MKLIIHVNPDKDGVHCKGCLKQRIYSPFSEKSTYCALFEKTFFTQGKKGYKRLPECLKAEAEAKERT